MHCAADLFRDCLPPDAIDTSDATYRYAAAGVIPGCVLQPTGIDGVAAALRAARAAGLALIPAGQATHLDIGRAPRAYDAALTTRRLNRVLAHDAADMTVTVEGGITLAALAGALAAQGQWLPLDPPDDGRATLGGIAATGITGAQAFGYGAPRHHVIGMRVALADGRIIKAGGRVVKNVAGYDMCKLFTGSYGTLGTIVELTFKLRPRPVHHSAARNKRGSRTTWAVASCRPISELEAP